MIVNNENKWGRGFHKGYKHMNIAACHLVGWIGWWKLMSTLLILLCQHWLRPNSFFIYCIVYTDVACKLSRSQRVLLGYIINLAYLRKRKQQNLVKFCILHVIILSYNKVKLNTKVTINFNCMSLVAILKLVTPMRANLGI